MTEIRFSQIEIKFSQITEYVPIEVQLLRDAQKYIARAEMYAAIGKFGHCAGCLAKAAKKIKKVEEMKISLDGMYAIFKPVMDQLSKNIADGILKEAKG